jgi:putative transposase
VARLPLFEKPEDYEALEGVIEEAFQREELPIFSYCVMSNHWHFVVRPQTKRQVTGFFRWLTNTHTMRWHAHHHTAGTGHLYQGRFKSFPIEEDGHLLSVVRYVERNPLRANNSSDVRCFCYTPIIGSFLKRIWFGISCARSHRPPALPPDRSWPLKY